MRYNSEMDFRALLEPHADGNITDEKTREMLAKYLAAFKARIELFNAVG